MHIEVEISGDVIERQELLNGTQTVTLEGTNASGAWMLAGSVSWNRGLVDYAGEGDITLSREDGAELFGTLTRSDAAAEGAEEGETSLVVAYEIDGGSGAFEGAAGTARATLRLSGGTFAGAWTVDLATEPRA